MIGVIILGVLAALMVSLWLVYSYINNIRTTDIHRKMLYDAVYESRYRDLQEQSFVKEDWTGESSENIKFQRINATNELEGHKARLGELFELKEQADLTQDQNEELRYLKDRIRSIESDLENYLSDERIAELKKKEEEQEQLRQQRDQKLREKAAQEAQTLVPPSLTVAGMGITGSFFIELTAILTIIFGIIILGLVEVLRTQEIATILAAIAGYVLGKTSASSQPAQPPAPPTPAVQATNPPAPMHEAPPDSSPGPSKA